MSYDKLTLASFKEALKAKKYDTATGARRAVGKAQTLSEDDKNSARKAIDAFFGTAPAKAPVKKSVKAAAPAKAKKAAPAAKKAPAKKAARAAKTSAKAGGKKTSPKKAEPAPVEEIAGTLLEIAAEDLNDLTSPATQLSIATRSAEVISGALSSVTQAKQMDPTSELGPFIEEISSKLTNAVKAVDGVVTRVLAAQQPVKVAHAPRAEKPARVVGDKKTEASAPPVEKVSEPAAKAAEHAPANGAVSTPTEAERLFAGSVPPAPNALAGGAHRGLPEDPDVIEVL